MANRKQYVNGIESLYMSPLSIWYLDCFCFFLEHHDFLSHSVWTQQLCNTHFYMLNPNGHPVFQLFPPMWYLVCPSLMPPFLVQPVLSPYMLQNLNFSTPVSTYDIASSLSLSKAAVLTFCPETLTSGSAQPPWHHQSLFAFRPSKFSCIFIQLGICKVAKWEFVVFFFSIMFHISFHLTSFAIVLFIQNTSVDLGSVGWDPMHMSPLFDKEKLSLPHEFRDTVMFRSCLPYIKI